MHQRPKQVDSLASLGCPDRRLNKLAAQIDSLLIDTTAMLPGQPGGLSESEIERLRVLGPRLKPICAELASYSIPQTLEHGDLWPDQILSRREKPVFIDWSDSSISHPFFSLNFLSDPIEMQPFLTRAPNVRERLSDAYLEPWASFAPMEKLKRIFKLADLLAPLHYATLYHTHILPNMEVQWEMEKMIPFYLKKLMRSFSSLNI
ncbi:phosphotransferase [Candidatus Acetothermia bacterium]|nr:phosphotransferase [Candidatus Acetothermia bacterium]